MIPAPYKGVNLHPFWDVDALIDETCQALAASNVQLCRIDVPMNYMFTQGRGLMHPGYTERINRFLAECPANIEILIVATGTPAWANGNRAGNVPWANPADFAASLTQLVQAFPRAAAWEVWNEPDEDYSWAHSTGTVEQRAAAYVQLLKAAYPAVKAAIANLKVVAPVISGQGSGPWLEAFYAADPHGFYDVFSAHMYGDPPSHGGLSPADTAQAFASEVWPLMASNGDGLSDLWITETGWTSYQPANGGFAGVSQAQQAANLTGIYQQTDLQIPQCRRLYWFEWNDVTATPSAPDQCYGLNTLDSTATRVAPKPALAAFNALP